MGIKITVIKDEKLIREGTLLDWMNGRLPKKSVWRKLCDLFREFFTVLLIASTLCGCVRTVYVSKQPDDLRCVVKFAGADNSAPFPVAVVVFRPRVSSNNAL